jgi:hypothetical protein
MNTDLASRSAERCPLPLGDIQAGHAPSCAVRSCRASTPNIRVHDAPAAPDRRQLSGCRLSPQRWNHGDGCGHRRPVISTLTADDLLTPRQPHGRDLHSGERRQEPNANRPGSKTVTGWARSPPGFGSPADGDGRLARPGRGLAGVGGETDIAAGSGKLARPPRSG